jgi:hypothetical protein
MTDRTKIKRDYWACRVGYETSLDALIATGLTASAADDYLFAKDADRETGEREGDERIANATAVFESARAAIAGRS